MYLSRTTSPPSPFDPSGRNGVVDRFPFVSVSAAFLFPSRERRREFSRSFYGNAIILDVSLSLSFSLRLAFPRGVALRFEGARKTRELLRTRIVPPLERRSIKLFPGFFCRCEKDAEPRFASIPSARLFISVSLSLVLPPPRKKNAFLRRLRIHRCPFFRTRDSCLPFFLPFPL